MIDKISKKINIKVSPFSKSLIAINVLIYAFVMLMGGPTLENLVQYGAKVNYLIVDGQLWRFLTSMFLHGSLTHLLFNMMALLILGRDIERIYGYKKFLIIYFVSGFFGSIGSFLLNDATSVGASGAIFGLLGANLYLLYLNPSVYKKVYGLDIIVLIGFNLIYGLTTPNIDNVAHFTGLAGGFLTAFSLGIINENHKAVKRRIIQLSIAAIIVLSFLFGYNNYKNSLEYNLNKSIEAIQNNDLESANYYVNEGLLLDKDSDVLIQLYNLLNPDDLIE